MSEFPSMPLFTDAFIADTGHLTATETGAYMMLLMMAWRLPDCRLPDDDRKLAKWARVDGRVWSRIKREVMAFWTLSDGHWTQKRLLAERHKVSKNAERARANGQHGGRPKSLKDKEPENPAGSSRVSQTKAPISISNPSMIDLKDVSVAARAVGPKPFPEQGPIDYCEPFASIARRCGRGLDVSRMAEAFRRWARGADVPFDDPLIARKFETFCGRHKHELRAA